MEMAASLPDGWARALDPGTQLPYYHNAAAGVTQWEPPGAPAGSAKVMSAMGRGVTHSRGCVRWVRPDWRSSRGVLTAKITCCKVPTLKCPTLAITCVQSAAP
jgi:hypothetical protein